ncbi:VOC family protein [Asticcacaulis solisilvae]|uniref:VOC family protein n=1 Tax=Asticcacaulis solisilvae TaxID=1217274 RepID=UPI003FD7EEC8
MKSITALTVLTALLTGPVMAAPARPPVTAVSHIAVYAADRAKTDAFYVHDLGAAKRSDPENAAGTRYYVSPTQFIEVLPLPADAGKTRLDHIAFATADAEAMRQYLAGQHVAVPAKVSVWADGSKSFVVTDPEGNRVEFTEGKPADVPVNALSGHIIHVGMIVHDRAKEDGFYRAVLGLRPYWYGGFKEDKPDWVSQQVPDGSDWLEYMLVAGPETSGIPAAMSQQTAGVLNHFSLGVTNAEAAYTTLWTGKRLEGQGDGSHPKIGLDAKWQINLYDPDGTRAEIMEFHAVGTPCCSPFTAKDPER